MTLELKLIRNMVKKFEMLDAFGVKNGIAVLGLTPFSG